MPWWVSQARRERANVRAKQEFCCAIQGVPRDDVLCPTRGELLTSATQDDGRTWMSMGVPSLNRFLI